MVSPAASEGRTTEKNEWANPIQDFMPKKRTPHTREDYKKDCERGVAESCYQLGIMLEQGKGGRTDKRRARKAFEKACLGEQAWACQNLGYMLDKGQGGRTDQRRARYYYEKACRGGVAMSCYNLGLSLWYGEGGPVDRPRAAEFLLMACRSGYRRDICPIPTPITGSKTDGIVRSSVVIDPSDVVVVDYAGGNELARARCRAWGFRDARRFGGVQPKCLSFDTYGNCHSIQLVIDYQCIE